MDQVTENMKNVAISTSSGELSKNDNPKKSKKNLTSYWGVSLNLSIVTENAELQSFLKSHDNLILLEKIHSTLLFVGKKENDNERVFIPLEGKLCQLEIIGFGSSESAIALDVKSITYKNDANESTDVPSFATKQHVTIALSKGTKAVESVKTLLGEGTYTKFDKPIIVTGTVKRYLF